ncbi:MAG: class I SAM-dependent RNA methyltransferase [Thermoanaerobaculales bacterium]
MTDPRDGVVLTAEKLVGGGRALAHHQGATWMVAGALPGEVVTALPDRRRAGVVEARVLEVLSNPHPGRTADPCPHAASCGGCDWPHVDPGSGARLKGAAAAEAARGFPELIARLAAAPVRASSLGYRLRARLHWDPGTGTLGFYESRSQRVVPIDYCRILSPRLMQALPALTAALAGSCPEPVDVEWLEGTAEGDSVAALRPGRDGPSKIDPSRVPIKERIAPAVAGFHTLSATGVPGSGWGAHEVTIELPTPLRVPVGCFFQGNRHLINPLFTRVAELTGPGSAPTFDLHAGVGFLAAAALFAGPRDLTLVEPCRPAARAAQCNLPDARVEVGRTAEAFLARAGHLPQDALVITDPPRTGMTRTLRKQLAQWLPHRILMLGCDPATWARDTGFLCGHGYRLVEIELFDLFPSTHHVEILALLERT